MRRLLLCSTIAAAMVTSVTVSSQRPESQPAFRAQVDVMTIDVTVFDRNGVPVEDLRPDDFVVKVGDETRRVLSAELTTVNRAHLGRTAIPVPPRFFSTNATPVTGRTVMFAVDQMQVAPGLTGAAARAGASVPRWPAAERPRRPRGVSAAWPARPVHHRQGACARRVAHGARQPRDATQ
jgi:hypothetical protein